MSLDAVAFQGEQTLNSNKPGGLSIGGRARSCSSGHNPGWGSTPPLEEHQEFTLLPLCDSPCWKDAVSEAVPSFHTQKRARDAKLTSQSSHFPSIWIAQIQCFGQNGSKHRVQQ
ncbi:unnamed protein product [Eretmochelys imbricata]